MSTYFLKFEDRAEALTALALSDESYKNEDGELIPQTDKYFVDVVGVIPLKVGEDDDGNAIFEDAEGYHINILADDLPEDLLPFAITPPTTPYRVFA